MTSWRRRLALLSLAVTAAGCTGATSGTKLPAEVKIGLLAPLSGPNAAAGRDAQRGAELAADVVNDRGTPLNSFARGLLRAGTATRLRIVTADTRSEPQQGVDAVVRLTGQDGAVALVGAYDPDVTLSASQRAERLTVPFVSGDTPLSSLTERGLDWFFRTGPDTRTYGEAFFSLLRRKEKEADGVSTRRVAVLYTNDRAGNDVDQVTKELADEGQFQVVREVEFDPTATDLSAQVSAVRGASPDALFFSSTPSSLSPLLNAFRQLNYEPPAVLAYGPGLDAPGVLPGAGPTGRGLCRQVAWSAEIAARNPTARAIAQRYQQKYGAPMTESAASSYTATFALARAMQSTGSVAPRELRSGLLALDVPAQDTVMPWNGIRFDETHQNAAAAGVVEQYQGGSFRAVFPRDVSSQAFAWPASSAA